jgi:phosphoglycolate phosphatase-like HAD superfamily hydrolase
MLNVCIDVDLTLIDEQGELLPGALDALEKLRKAPCELTLWSAAGAEYSKEVAARLRLGKFFQGYAGKPDIAIDDDPSSLKLKKLIVKNPEDLWDQIQQQTIRALHQISEETE